jgi:ribosomal protein S18 acetylase RimI-like enzyme
MNHPSILVIEQIGEAARDEVRRLVIERWGSTLMLSRGVAHAVDQLPGLLAKRDGKIQGLITFQIQSNECEIVSLDSLAENQGVGSALLDSLIGVAKAAGCLRIWLITTNDNTAAIRFYQKRGFSLNALYLNAIEASRRIKPEIPVYGVDGIPILHELEFELNLVHGGG